MPNTQPSSSEALSSSALAASSFVPVLVDDGTFEVRLARRLRIAGEDVHTAIVLAQRFGSADEAQRRLDWLLTRSARLTEWGRTAAILGPDALDATIDLEWGDEVRQLEEARHRAQEEAEKEKEFGVYFEEVGRYHKRPAILLRQGCYRNPAVLTLVVDQTWERDRIYDWLQWQEDDFEAWKAYREEHGHEALERLILTEMLRTETAVKKAGLGSGGRRPLRFWRGEPK